MNKLKELNNRFDNFMSSHQTLSLVCFTILLFGGTFAILLANKYR